MEKRKRSTADKIRIYRSFFTGLPNVYGTYDTNTGRVRQAKEPVTEQVIRAHLSGKRSYGVYLLVGERITALAVDFDQDELSAPVAYVARARRYGIWAYIERSKSKGYHVWIFFEEPVLARKARLVAKKILADIGRPATEIFPKQDALANGVSYGNFINAPLFGALVPKGRTVFVDPDDPSKAYPDQWELLENLQRVPELRLEAVIESCNLEGQRPLSQRPQSPEHTNSGQDRSSFGLPPCARRMLEDGVSSNQRISCFRLAIHFKRSGIPYDLALVTLKGWAKKNHPSDGKGIITEPEVEAQTKCAYNRPYCSFGCEDPAIAAYCDPNCPVYAHTRAKERVS